MLFDSAFDSYNTRSSNGASPASSESSTFSNDNSLTPTQLLALAIRKRRRLIDDKDRDFRRELLHTSVIQSLCKHLGENRAKARRCRRRPRRRPSKRRWSVEEEEEDQEVPDSSGLLPPPPPLSSPAHEYMGYDSALQSTGGPGLMVVGNLLLLPTEQQHRNNWDGQPESDTDGGRGPNQTGASMAAMSGNNNGLAGDGKPTPCKRARHSTPAEEREEERPSGFALYNLDHQPQLKCAGTDAGYGTESVGHGLFKYEWTCRQDQNGPKDDDDNNEESLADMAMMAQYSDL